MTGTAPPTPAFVRRVTSPRHPPLVPELTVRTGDDVITVWEATEHFLGGAQEPPFWAFAWAGGQAVARYVLDHAEVVARRHVLDFACGCGVAGIAAAGAGGQVTVADVDPLALVAARTNAEDNGVQVRCLAADLLAPVGGEDGAQGGPGDMDVVLAGDVFYARELAARVEPFLRAAAARGAVVLIGDPQRRYLPRHGLDALASYDVPVPVDLEGMAVRRTTVYRVWP